ncbi:MAG: type I-A CRISPR-associated protein Cas5a [Candidatus Bathyarchaeia archaeon]
MLGLKVTASLHWGFWSRAPSTSKVQPSLPVFPPTTLLGALAADLARRTALRFDDLTVGGEFWHKNGQLFSLASLLDEAVVASAYFKDGTMGFPYQDINKYVTLHYHQTVLTDGIPRRYHYKFRMGAVPVGKIVASKGLVSICYLLDEQKCMKLLHDDWKRNITLAAFNIERLGSKESIVSVESVDLITPIKLQDKAIRTCLYFPVRSVEENSVEGEFYTETFWKGGWLMGGSPQFEEYIIPGRRLPVRSGIVSARLKSGEAYEFGPEEILIVP